MQDEINALQNILGAGQEKAIHQSELAAAMCVTTTKLKRMIHDSRIAGLPVLSDHHGYYLANTVREWEKFNKMMGRQAASRLAVLEALEKGAAR